MSKSNKDSNKNLNSDLIDEIREKFILNMSKENDLNSLKSLNESKEIENLENLKSLILMLENKGIETFFSYLGNDELGEAFESDGTYIGLYLEENDNKVITEVLSEIIENKIKFEISLYYGRKIVLLHTDKFKYLIELFEKAKNDELKSRKKFIKIIKYIMNVISNFAKDSKVLSIEIKPDNISFVYTSDNERIKKDEEKIMLVNSVFTLDFVNEFKGVKTLRYHSNYKSFEDLYEKLKTAFN